MTVGGNIIDVREITTKNGQKMAFVRIGDQSNEIEIVLFPSIYQQTIGIWERDRIVIVKGKISAQDRDSNVSDELKVLGDDAREVTYEQATAYQPAGKKPKIPKPGKTVPQKKKDNEETNKNNRVYLRLKDSDNGELLISLKQTIDLYQGDHEVSSCVGR